MGDERVSHEFETIRSLCGEGKTLVVGWVGVVGFDVVLVFLTLEHPCFFSFVSSILLQGPTEAMLVDFLLSLRADVKGVMRRIASTIRRYELSSSTLTVSASSSLDASGFADLSNSGIKNNEEQVTLSEVAYFLKSTGGGGGRRQARHNTNVQTKDITMLFCRSIINLGLSIQGRGQQKNRRVWVLVRRKALHLVDSELDQLLDENEEEEKRRRERRRVVEEEEEEQEARGASKMESPSSRSTSSKVLPITPIVMTNLKQVRERRERPEEPRRQRGQREQQQHSLNVTPIVVQRKKLTSFGKK